MKTFHQNLTIAKIFHLLVSINDKIASEEKRLLECFESEEEAENLYQILVQIIPYYAESIETYNQQCWVKDFYNFKKMKKVKKGIERRLDYILYNYKM